MRLEPLEDRLVVKAIEAAEVSAGGVILPENAKEKPQRGTVVAVGPGKVAESGARVALDIEPGDEILYSKYGGTEVEVDGEELLVVRQADVLARVT